MTLYRKVLRSSWREKTETVTAETVTKTGVETLTLNLWETTKAKVS